MIAASFVVPTRGRVEMIGPLLRSIQSQSVPIEILIMDDGGSPELARLVRRDFPGVQYHALATGRGPAFQRNRGIELASAEFVFPFDDDTRLPSPRTVEQTLGEFDHPRIAAVAIPYVNVRADQIVRQAAPDRDDVWVLHAFVGAAHAVRRSRFLEVGGYRDHFFYMGEEGDLAVRWLALGEIVRAGSADHIEHLESPLRNSALADHYGRRNDILFAWHNVPSAHLAPHLAGTTLNGLVTATRVANPGRALIGMARGFADIPAQWRARQPVSAAAYRLQRLLKTTGPLRLRDIDGRLPVLASRSCSIS